jgi:hypothetical protein
MSPKEKKVTEVYELIEDSINDIFYESQGILGIEFGDVTMEEHDNVSKARDIMLQVLLNQLERGQ